LLQLLKLTHSRGKFFFQICTTARLIYTRQYMLKHTMISFHANNENACVDRHSADVMESFRMRNDHIMTKII
jgi:hypothetical protein